MDGRSAIKHSMADNKRPRPPNNLSLIRTWVLGALVPITCCQWAFIANASQAKPTRQLMPANINTIQGSNMFHTPNKFQISLLRSNVSDGLLT